MQTPAQHIVWSMFPLVTSFPFWIKLAILYSRTNSKIRCKMAIPQTLDMWLLGLIGLFLFFLSLFIASAIDAHAMTSNIN